MKNIGVGIIGTGGIAGTGHAPAINAVNETELVSVLSRDSKQGKDFLDKHSSPRGSVHTSLSDFVGDSRIDLAIICTPDGLHYEQAKACLEAGKHVLLEKPMALTVDEARELVYLAKDRNLKLAIGFHLRSHNGHIELRNKIENGVIGKLHHIRAIWAFSSYDDSNWRANDKMTKWWSLSAVGAHCLDQARWFANDIEEWKQYSAVTSNRTWNGPHDETAIISGQFSSGVTLEVTSSVQFGPYSRLELFGDKGFAVCSGTFGRDGTGRITIDEQLMDYVPVNPFNSQLQNIVQSIFSKEDLRADGSTGLRNVEDLIAAIGS
jgi:1,5-anhydro-D-fructose reductase (1,5-anhydro-D-mannitol-forming)